MKQNQNKWKGYTHYEGGFFNKNSKKTEKLTDGWNVYEKLTYILVIKRLNKLLKSFYQSGLML